jgi:hypothetical protein
MKNETYLVRLSLENTHRCREIKIQQMGKLNSLIADNQSYHTLVLKEKPSMSYINYENLCFIIKQCGEKFPTF